MRLVARDTFEVLLQSLAVTGAAVAECVIVSSHIRDADLEIVRRRSVGSPGRQLVAVLSCVPTAIDAILLGRDQR
jgi:hypothetical protein